MANDIYIPRLNPIRLVKYQLDVADAYQMPQFSQALYRYLIQSFQSGIDYGQKFQKTENIVFELITNYVALSAVLVDCQGNEIEFATATAISTNYIKAPYSALLCTIDTSAVPDGRYWVIVRASSDLLVSEPIDIATSWPGTMLVQYGNNKNIQNMIFQNGETFYFRVESILTDFQPGANRTVYEDQTADLVPLFSAPFRSWTWVIGDGVGVPDWVADLVNRISMLSNVTYDNAPLSREEGAAMERVGDRLVATAGWSLKMREKTAKYADLIRDELPVNRAVTTVQVDAALFGGVGSVTVYKVE